jgi:hypothetical protein
MNTTPDETRLALWLEDELHGEELTAFDAWVADRPEHLAAREDMRRWRRLMAEGLPREEEPPYPDFFNQRIAKSIRDLTPVPAAVSKPRFSLSSWFMPLTACAGMVLAFWLGGKRNAIPEIDVTGAPRAIPVEPILYTPEKGVTAEWFDSLQASATVIVLNGVQAIPDDTDFSETAYIRRAREIDSTAANESSNPPIE